MEAEKAKTKLATELTALHKQVDKTKVDVVAEFQVLQPFFDACGTYYGYRFDDCLKQVQSVYPDLDLSQIIIDDTTLPTPREDDADSSKTNDSAHTVEWEVKDDDMIITQPAPKGPIAPIVSSTVDPLPECGPTTTNLMASDAPPSRFSPPPFFKLYLNSAFVNSFVKQQ